MGGLDAHQFWKAIEVSDVTSCHRAAGDQVIEGSTDVDHHLAGRHLLKTITGQLRHQNVHHVFSCQSKEEG